jgi:hypothetical protein
MGRATIRRREGLSPGNRRIAAWKRSCRAPVFAPAMAMAVSGALLLGIVLVVIPWLVILASAAVGLNFFLALAMLMVFSVGLLLMAAITPEA